MTELLTAQEVAARWKCAPRMVHRLVDAGRLTAILLGTGARSRRFDPAEIARYINDAGREACQSRNAAPSGGFVYKKTDDVLASLLAPKRSRSKPSEKSSRTSSANARASGQIVRLPTLSRNT